MKPDERALMVAVYLATKDGAWVHVSNTADDLGIPWRRQAYLLERKWWNKGWYEYGVAWTVGWLTPEGRAKAEQLLADDDRRSP